VLAVFDGLDVTVGGDEEIGDQADAAVGGWS
jgi:hypothetical protein